MEQYNKLESEHIPLHRTSVDLLLNSITTSGRWWSKETVGIVTGGNRGIGYAIVKRLAEMGLTVILTARDVNRGLQALSSLQTKGLFNVHFFSLDVSDPSSIQTFVHHFSSNFSALDILVNNAAVSFNDIGENSVEKAETVIKTNYLGAKLLTESLLPFFRFSSSSRTRLLNITSRLGSLDKVKNPGIKEILKSESVSEEEIETVVRRFLEEVKSGRWRSGGWPEQWTDYAVSKLALNAYTRLLAKRYRDKGLSVNCYCPGFTQTAMTRGKGTHTADAAGEVAALLALLPPENLPTSKFFVWSDSDATPINTTLHSKL